jgi:hypothetical protein
MCSVNDTLQWQKTHPNQKAKNTKEYMRAYMKEYRAKNPKKIREIVKVEKMRRHRELPTEVILNTSFKGSDLHHMTPSIAVYIPSELHESIHHNLKTGEGMEEINKKVEEYFIPKLYNLCLQGYWV